MANLATNIQSVAAEQPDAVALSFRGRDVTYGEFWARTGQFAAGLDDRGIGEGDRVAVYLPNVPQFVTAFHGTLRAGGVVVPMNPQYKSREIAHLLSDSGARAVVTLSDLVPFVEEVRDDTDLEHVVTVGEAAEAGTDFEAFLGDDHEPTLADSADDSGVADSAENPAVVDRADDDVAVQPYTSGTTGQPKGVQLTHRNLASNAETAADLVPEGIRTNDKQLGVLPLFHIYGMTVVMNATLFNGGEYYPLPEWDAQEAVSLVEDEGLTLMHGVPAMYNDVINQPNAEEFDLSSLRLAGVGGSGIPVEVLRQFEDLYDVKIYEGYGLTETSPVTHFNSPKQGRRVGSIGKTLPGVEAKIVDDDFEERPPVEKGPVDEEETDLDGVTGELVVAGPNVMKGYAGLPEANESAFTERDGTRWFHTGDLGYWDEDGFFYVVDRKKHMINTAGYNVYPREVEELLFEHEAVADAAVVGIPDDRRGETVKAFVVPVPDADVTPDEIRQFCLDRLAEYKHPREVEFVEELPRTTTGKVQKFELRERETTEGTE
ncbi:long-chain fatty acid--CoA ligase [Halorussus gelatinilyticus]|uniref:Long-chain fatty acid--CoA ligase n=1 Tax=Halorussus gelatinilyticus TaxID=2937524 RepID=A0A8U0ID85_9EURY|nr:long-chain fatty acid--CoA ligase [Halorussus gelatinilyticus]UPV98912.1 long-chain fatty acid--CoA ligase [Halorussus gelatinilyticus]